MANTIKYGILCYETVTPKFVFYVYFFLQHSMNYVSHLYECGTFVRFRITIKKGLT